MRLETARLLLRPWEPRDRAPYAAMVTDPEMRRYYTEIPSIETAFGWVDGYNSVLAAVGFHWLAVERKADGRLLGDAGLALIDQVTRDAMKRPCAVEIGWTIERQSWGQGYATEAAAACLHFAWDVAGLPEVIAFTQAQNAASERVMQKLGMTRDPQFGFEDPTVPPGHWQRPHLIYRISNPRERDQQK